MWKDKKISLLLILALLLTGCGGQSQKKEVLLYEEEESTESASGSAVSGGAVSGSPVNVSEEEFETTTVRNTTYKEEFSDTAELEYTDTEVLHIDDEDAVLDAVKVKKYQRVKKGDVLAVYHIETSKTKLEKERLLVSQARANYEAGLSSLNKNVSQAKKEVNQLSSQAEKKMKQLEIKKMEKEIAAYKKTEKEVISQEKEYNALLRKQKKTNLVAKKSGVITATGKSFEGEKIDSSTDIVEMRQSDKWMLVVKDPDSKLRYNMDVSVRLGSSVKEYQHEIKGKVITAGDLTGSGQTDEEGESLVYIEVSEADKKKYDFEKFNVYIYAVTFSVKDALVVDAQAVDFESVGTTNKLFVWLVENGKLHKRFIVSNYNTEDEYLIEQGVFADQKLAILN